jgi:hypothetical protein
MYHLNDIINNCFIAKDKEKQKLKLHRTKCSALIKNVLAPSFLEDIISDVRNSPYSLIVDEWMNPLMFLQKDL